MIFITSFKSKSYLTNYQDCLEIRFLILTGLTKESIFIWRVMISSSPEPLLAYFIDYLPFTFPVESCLKSHE